MPSQLNLNNRMTKDVLYRSTTVALLDALNRELSVIHLNRQGKEESHQVPIFYHYGNDENFMKDFFIQMPNDCAIPNHAEGNFDIWPRGVLRLTGITIKDGEITNKFVRAGLKIPVEDENGRTRIDAYSAYLFAVPVALQYTLTLHGDTMNQGLQLVEQIIDSFYKQFVFYYQHKGIRIPAQYEFSEEYTPDKKFEFDYDDNQKLHIPVNIKVETYQPVFDENNVQPRGRRILEWINSINYTEGVRQGIDPSTPPGPTGGIQF